MKPELLSLIPYEGGCILSGETPWAMIRCPQCRGVGSIDLDQFEGRVSIQCDCGYHETHDLRQSAKEA